MRKTYKIGYAATNGYKIDNLRFADLTKLLASNEEALP